jgi:hypothetical protein
MFDVLLSSIKFLRRPGGLARTPSVIAGRQVPEWTRDPPDFKNFAENFRHRSGRNPVRSSWLILRRKAAMPARPALAKVVEDIMKVHRTLAAATATAAATAAATPPTLTAATIPPTAMPTLPTTAMPTRRLTTATATHPPTMRMRRTPESGIGRPIGLCAAGNGNLH